MMRYYLVVYCDTRHRRNVFVEKLDGERIRDYYRLIPNLLFSMNIRCIDEFFERVQLFQMEYENQLSYYDLYGCVDVSTVVVPDILENASLEEQMQYGNEHFTVTNNVVERLSGKVLFENVRFKKVSPNGVCYEPDDEDEDE